MKKFINISIFILFTVMMFVSCEKKEVKAHDYPEKVHFTMAEVNAEDSICGRMDVAFKQKLEELSNGNLTVEIKYYGVLGDEAQIIRAFEASGDSSVQIARVSANLSNYGAKKSKLLTVPYIFYDDAHFWRFAKSDVAEEILDEPYENGLGFKGLCYAEEGLRHFFCTEPISSLQDLQGKKMRVSGQTLSILSKSLQTIPVDVPYTNLYVSLQTGKVDVAEQPLSNYLNNAFYKVAPYVIMDGHTLGAVEIIISSKCWDNLSYYQQVLVKKAADYASLYCKDILSSEETSDAIELLTKGVTLMEVADKGEWQKACSETIKENTKNYQDLYEKILGFKE